MSSEDVERATLMIQNLSLLRDDPSFSDIIVIVDDSEFSCHRAILASASDFFKAAFTTDMRETKEGKISLQGIDKKLFQTLLDFIYCCKSIVTEENLFELWAAADMLQMKGLISECKKLMFANLSQKNAVFYLSKVRGFGEDVNKRVLEFVCKELEQLDRTSICETLNKSEMKFIISDNTIRIPEDRAIGLLIRWAENQLTSTSCEKLGDDTDSSEDQEQESSISEWNASVSECLAELLECSRYLINTESCLHGALKRHQLVQSNKKCESLVDNIVWYQYQQYLHQSWCPHPATYREHSDMMNVMLFCKVDEQCPLTMLCLQNMEWKKITLKNHETRYDNVLFHDSKIYYVDSAGISLYLPATSSWLHAKMDLSQKYVRPIGKTIFSYEFPVDKNLLQVTGLTDSAYLHNTSSQVKCCSLIMGKGELKDMSIKEVTSIGNIHVVFLGRKYVDNYTIACYDKFRGCYCLHHDQLGSRSKLVRQSTSNSISINLTQELVLWDGETFLTGAVLYDEELLVVGEFPNQTEDFEILDRSLDGVFKRVRKIKSSLDIDNKCPRISLGVLPKSILA